MNKPVARTTISLPEPVLKRGQANAKKKLRNFSSYLADLIVSDSRALETSKEGSR